MAPIKSRQATASIVAFFLLALSAMSTASELPAAPPGYSWAKFPKIKAALLRPESWYVKKVEKTQALGIFISKDNIESDGSFETGLSVNINFNIPERIGMSASEFANELIAVADAEAETIRQPWSRSMGTFQSYGIVSRNRDERNGDYITHNLAIANDATGTLYLFVFEAPETEWEQAWAIAEPMMQKLLIDTEV